MPAPHDLDPDAMTEEERRAKRRFEAGFAFETMPESEWVNPKTGHGEDCGCISCHMSQTQ